MGVALEVGVDDLKAERAVRQNALDKEHIVVEFGEHHFVGDFARRSEGESRLGRTAAVHRRDHRRRGSGAETEYLFVSLKFSGRYLAGNAVQVAARKPDRAQCKDKCEQYGQSCLFHNWVLPCLVLYLINNRKDQIVGDLEKIFRRKKMPPQSGAARGDSRQCLPP